MDRWEHMRVRDPKAQDGSTPKGFQSTLLREKRSTELLDQLEKRQQAAEAAARAEHARLLQLENTKDTDQAAVEPGIDHTLSAHEQAIQQQRSRAQAVVARHKAIKQAQLEVLARDEELRLAQLKVSQEQDRLRSEEKRAELEMEREAIAQRAVQRQECTYLGTCQCPGCQE